MTLHGHIGVTLGSFSVDIDLSVGNGETVVVIGPNGAGKSTLLRAVAGLVALDHGRLVCDDVVWDDPVSGAFVGPEDRRVGMVFQSHALIPHLDARANVAFGLRARGVPRAVAMSTADDWLSRMGVAELASLLPRQLSGGQSQRVAMARALAVDPTMLLLDEPMSALDVPSRSAMRELLVEPAGTARIIVTHDPIDALTLADRVVVVESGTVVQAGRPSELIEAPRSTYVAEILGVNPLRGALDGNRLDVGGMTLTVGAHTAPDGEVIAIVRPRSISLHRQRPEGSPRNVWLTRIGGIDRGPDRVRVRLVEPLAVTVEVTPAGLDDLGLGIGDEVWASVKASEISVSDG